MRFVSGTSNVVKTPTNLLKVRKLFGPGTLHKQRKDFHDMIQPGIRSSSISQWSYQSLCNDSANLSGSSTDTMRSRTISGREDFSRNDKSSGVRTEVLEKVAETVEGK